LNFFRKPPNNTDDFSIRQWFTIWTIPTEFFVGDSLYTWHDEQCSQFTSKFTDGITNGICFVGNSVGKNDTSSFFLFCFNFFSHGNSLGICWGNISVGKIPQKFTDENIPLIFPFVFINFLVVTGQWLQFASKMTSDTPYISQEVTLDVHMRQSTNPPPKGKLRQLDP